MYVIISHRDMVITSCILITFCYANCSFIIYNNSCWNQVNNILIVAFTAHESQIIYQHFEMTYSHTRNSCKYFFSITTWHCYRDRSVTSIISWPSLAKWYVTPSTSVCIFTIIPYLWRLWYFLQLFLCCCLSTIYELVNQYSVSNISILCRI